MPHLRTSTPGSPRASSTGGEPADAAALAVRAWLGRLPRLDAPPALESRVLASRAPRISPQAASPWRWAAGVAALVLVGAGLALFSDAAHEAAQGRPSRAPSTTARRVSVIDDPQLGPFGLDRFDALGREGPDGGP